MKRFYFLLFAAMMLLPGCKSLFESNENYTPSVIITPFITSSGDTLTYHYNYTDKKYNSDTITLGDTIRFGVVFQSFANNLVESNINWEESNLSLSYSTDSIYPALKNYTAENKLHFYYKGEAEGGGYNGVGLVITMVPIKAGKSEMTFFVQSDASSEKISNTASNSLTVIVADTIR